MSWWETALYDTCSLITLDKLYQERPSLSQFFPAKILALGVSLSIEQMREETAARLKARVQLCALPPPAELACLLSAQGLSKALSDVDRLVYATALFFNVAVVTGDKRLAKAARHRGLEVGNVALILRELVETKKLTSSSAEDLLRGLAHRKDYLLGVPNPTWHDLKKHIFPN
ncbi:MAG: hypothetical protein ACOX1P_31405 [Thermoguttaceae bacterium]|jgi:hypothetical protein